MATLAPAQRKSLEAKALKEDNKSEGMRSLFAAGYTVAEVRDVFEVEYGYAYGVATRGGFVTSTPREPKASANGTGKAKASAKTAPAPAAKRGRPAKASAAPTKSAAKAAPKTAAAPTKSAGAIRAAARRARIKAEKAAK